MVMDAMLPDEAVARSVLGDKRCGRILLEMDAADDDPEIWAYLANLARFAEPNVGGEEQIQTALTFMEVESKFDAC